MRLPVAAVVCCLSVALCGTASAEGGERGRFPRLLPAWKTPQERREGRFKDSNDQLDAFRLSHPELYGVTEPPAASLQVRLPAEFEPVADVYLVWWPGGFDQTYLAVTRAVLDHGGASVNLLHHGAQHRADLETLLDANGVDATAVNFLDLSATTYYTYQDPFYDSSLDTIWIGDYGPSFVEDGQGRLSVVDLRYYGRRVNDDGVPPKLAELLGIGVFRPDLRFEGGNLLSDGQSTCYATLKHENWNLPLSRHEVESAAAAFLGCVKVIWLQPLYEEKTGHIDMFFKVVDPRSVVVGSYAPADDPINATILDENASLLEAETNAQGQGLSVSRMPMPPPDPVLPNPEPVFRTYLNSLTINDLVLIPVYPQHDDHQSEALAVYQQLYPGKILEVVDAEEVITHGGALHCIARTRPAGTLAPAGPDPPYACGGAFTCLDGCGALDGTGMCSSLGYLARCESGEVLLSECRGGLFCGFDVEHGRFDCVSLGCGSVTSTGTCLDSGGAAIAVYCRELSSANFVVQAEVCAPDGYCAVDPNLGRTACMPPCADECAAGEVGCSADLAERWVCRLDRTGSGCMVRVFEPCPAGIECRQGYCCDDTCVPGESGCWPGSRGLWVCGPAGDAPPCYERQFVACPESTRCSDATCVPSKSSSACHCRAILGGLTRGVPAKPALFVAALALWLALGYARSFRRNRTRSKQT